MNKLKLLFLLAGSGFLFSFNSIHTNPKKSKQKSFNLYSKEFQNNGEFPKKYTCDSLGISPALLWENAPKGTKSFAITMHHIAPKGERHVYMILYNVPNNVFSIQEKTAGIGIFGKNTINDRNQYAPPCSKGPGPKLYILTAYALSSTPEFKDSNYGIDMDSFQESIKNITLDSSVLNVYYSRQPKS
jgi:phosphatidylethanolamine-binding protein (PEBP) family uncharacterized protein